MYDWLERRPSHPGTMVVGFLMIERRWWQFTRGTWCTDVAIPLFQIRGTARGRVLGFLVVWAFSVLSFCLGEHARSGRPTPQTKLGSHDAK